MLKFTIRKISSRNVSLLKQGFRLYSIESKKTNNSELTYHNRRDLIREKITDPTNEFHYYPPISKIRQMHPNFKVIQIDSFITKFGAADLTIKDDSIPEDYLIEGQIKSIRRSGRGLYFIDLIQNDHKLQIMASNKSMNMPMEKFDSLHSWFKIGDVVSCNGFASRTKTGELTLKVNRPITMLTPRLKEVPKNITEKSLINSNRVLNYLSNPESKKFIVLKSRIIQTIRNFFLRKEFLEVQTPILSGSGTGANANPFVTNYKSNPVHLRVAPELWLKKLVTGGFEKIFEIGTNFRNEGIDQTHNPEFTSCEFYQTYTSLDELINLTEELFTELFQKFGAFSGTRLKFARYEFLPTLELQTGLEFKDLSYENLAQNYEKLNLEIPKNANPTNMLNVLSEIYLESLSITKHKNEPIIIFNQPEILSPLAKSITDENGNVISLRFELFINGKEYVNAYEEENNPKKQFEKFKMQQKNKIEFNDEEMLIPDWTYVKTMEYALPPTGGWGCGIERLAMYLSNVDRIDAVLPFGNLKDVLKQ